MKLIINGKEFYYVKSISICPKEMSSSFEVEIEYLLSYMYPYETVEVFELEQIIVTNQED
jgi:hypothetical protein